MNAGTGSSGKSSEYIDDIIPYPILGFTPY
jgi:hypothetical protein